MFFVLFSTMLKVLLELRETRTLKTAIVGFALLHMVSVLVGHPAILANRRGI